MSDDDNGRPSNPWAKPTDPQASVPEVGQPDPAPSGSNWGVDGSAGQTSGSSSHGGLRPRPASARPGSSFGGGEIRYDDSEGGLASLAIKGYLLTLVTLGIYRFWYITDVRRYFWSHTHVHNSTLEYTGRGLEIFIGFLIALAIFIPLQAISTYLAISMGPAGPLVSLLLAPIYLLLVFFAIYRSGRYRVNRTLWRGLRAHQTGSGWPYALRAFGWMLVVLVTFGFAVPWAATDLYRYRIERVHLGTVPFSFKGDWRLIAKPYWIIWAVFVLPVLIFGVLALSQANIPGLVDAATFDLNGQMRVDETKWNVEDYPIILFGPAVLGWSFISLFFIPYYFARRTSALFTATELLGVKCETRISAGRLYWIYFLYCAIILLASAILGGLVVALVGVLGVAGGSSPFGGIFAVGGAIIGYLAFFIMLGLVSLLFLQRKVWALIVGSITILNPERLDEIAGRMLDNEGGFGAGFADAMDVGDFDVGF